MFRRRSLPKRQGLGVTGPYPAKSSLFPKSFIPLELQPVSPLFPLTRKHAGGLRTAPPSHDMRGSNFLF